MTAHSNVRPPSNKYRYRDFSKLMKLNIWYLADGLAIIHNDINNGKSRIQVEQSNKDIDTYQKVLYKYVQIRGEFRGGNLHMKISKTSQKMRRFFVF